MKLYASIYLFAFVLFIVVALILPFYSEAGITFLGDTISELGAQQTKGNWAINGALLLMSLATLIYGSYVLKQKWIQLILLYFFGVSFGMTAIYQQAGFDTLIHYDYTHDALHALFLILSGFAFVVFCISVFFKVKVKIHKAQTAIVLLIAIGFSFLQFQLPQYQGIFQRVMFLLCFGWLFYAFTSYTFEESNQPYFNKMKQYQNLKKHLYPDEE